MMKDVEVDENAFKPIEAIIYSMTKEERNNPDLINGTRKDRIARGSGTSIQQVNNLLKQFEEMRKMVKTMNKTQGKMPMPNMKGMRR
jgi:signal recognition particle subunit SRP54